jgi:nucleotide-binding universal stress UspA family protein
MFHAIVVPHDGTEFAARALPAAGSLASAFGASLRVIGIAPTDAELALTYDHVHASVDDFASRFADDIDVEVDIVVDPQPVDVLLGVAAKEENVLCLASHDRPAPAARVMHSIGSQLIERSSHPLVVVGPRATPIGSGNDIVVALDPESDAEPVLVTGADWARALHAPLRVVTVFEPVPSDLDRPAHYTRRYGPSGDAGAYAASMAQRVADVGVLGVEAVAVEDAVSPSSGLLEHLRDHPARLAVIGGGHRHAPDLGGVARHLLTSASVPLVIVKYPR